MYKGDVFIIKSMLDRFFFSLFIGSGRFCAPDPFCRPFLWSHFDPLGIPVAVMYTWTPC